MDEFLPNNVVGQEAPQPQTERGAKRMACGFQLASTPPFLQQLQIFAQLPAPRTMSRWKRWRSRKPRSDTGPGSANEGQTEELFSTVGDYGLRTLSESENQDDIVE